jgi:hypothetical protein
MTDREHTVTNRERVDEALQRVALLSFLYYPEVHVDEPGYTLSSDVDFCMEALGELGEGPTVRDLIGRAIIDPTGYREELFATLNELAGPEPDDQ